MIKANSTIHPCLEYSNVLGTITKPLQSLGVIFFGYTAMDQKGDMYCLGSKPDYASAYLQHNHVHSDVQYRPDFVTDHYHYHFWDFVNLDKNAAELYQMAANFKQSHTLTVMRFTETITHCFHFSGALDDVGINQRYLERLDVIHAYIDYFSKCLQHMPEVADIFNHPTHTKKPVVLDPKPFTILADNPKKIILENVAQQELRFKNAAHYYLTINERICLAWLHQGKSAEMIANITGVSRKTIERHVSAIKRKYDCYTLYQLGEKISASGLTELL